MLFVIGMALSVVVLIVWLNAESERATGPTLGSKFSEEERQSKVTAVWYTIHTPDTNERWTSYDLESKTFHGPFDPQGLSKPFRRMNQTNDLCFYYFWFGPYSLSCENTEEGFALRVYDESKGMILDQIFTIADIGLEPSANTGFFVPVGAFSDGSALLLGRRVETESYVSGLWRMDIPSGEISEISAVRDNHIFHYDINPKTKQLIGTSFTPPENLGAPPTGPSAVYLINLLTGDTRILQSSETTVFENAMLDDAGLRYTFRNYDETFYDIYTVSVDKNERMESGQGIIRDWFDDTLVVDRDGNLVLIDLATHTEKVLTQESDASVEYLGVTR